MPRTNTLQTIKGRAMAVNLAEMMAVTLFKVHGSAIMGFLSELAILAYDATENGEPELAEALRAIATSTSDYLTTCN